MYMQEEMLSVIRYVATLHKRRECGCLEVRTKKYMVKKSPRDVDLNQGSITVSYNWTCVVWIVWRHRKRLG